MVYFFLKAVEKQAVKNLQIAEKIKTLYEEMKILFLKPYLQNIVYRHWISSLQILFSETVSSQKTQVFRVQPRPISPGAYWKRDTL